MTTKIVTTIAAMREVVAAARRQGQSVGCVPTMGALHAGHGSLIDQTRPACGLLVVTIFVNPIQFDRQQDYQAYAKDLDADKQFCEERKVDVIFAPSVAEMYPEPLDAFVDVPEVSRYLCGAFRPGHFRGVATVVAKLFNIVQPDIACFGAKDRQQLAVIHQMVQDLNFPVTLIEGETVRESDGLALSSRNVRLTPDERAIAPLLFHALSAARQVLTSGQRQTATAKRAAFDILNAESTIRVEYFEVVDSRMKPVESVAGKAWIAAAIWLGSTRLIDNLALLPASTGVTREP
jgi:pantoate--beta-alanine ligase